MLHLFFSEDLIQAFVDFSPITFSFVDRIVTLFIHNTRYFLKQQFILPLDLSLSTLFNHLSFTIIDNDSLRMLHQFGSNRLDIL